MTSFKLRSVGLCVCVVRGGGVEKEQMCLCVRERDVCTSIMSNNAVKISHRISITCRIILITISLASSQHYTYTTEQGDRHTDMALLTPRLGITYMYTADKPFVLLLTSSH